MTGQRILCLAALSVLLAACASSPRQSSAPSARPNTDLTGTWVLTTRSRMGSQESDMVVRQSGAAIDGTLSSYMGRVAYRGKVEGDAIAFDFTINAQGTQLPISYTGTVAGDTMSGKAVFGAFGEGTFVAKRKQ